jgi:hypothetical protein
MTAMTVNARLTAALFAAKYTLDRRQLAPFFTRVCSIFDRGREIDFGAAHFGGREIVRDYSAWLGVELCSTFALSVNLILSTRDLTLKVGGQESPSYLFIRR